MTPNIVLFHVEEGVLVGIDKDKLMFQNLYAGANIEILGLKVAAAIGNLVLPLLQKLACNIWSAFDCQ